MNVNNFAINKKYFTYALLFIISFFVISQTINAACSRENIGYCSETFIVQKGGSLTLGNYKTVRLQRQNDSRDVHCILHNVQSPAYGSHGEYTKRTCNSTYSFSSNNDKIRAAVGYVMSTSLGYVEKQYLIHRFLYLYASGAETSYVSGYDDYYNAAVSAYNNYPNTPGTYYLANFYDCGSEIQPISDGYETIVIPPKYTNVISHWTWGYEKGEGNNGDKRAFHLENTTFEGGVAGNTFVMNDGRKVTIPNGFYLNQSFGTSAIDGYWGGYAFGTIVTQKEYSMGFEYDYSPYNYSITYELNGGTNSSSNPSTYNVLYGVSFKPATRTGYVFDGWYEDASFTTPITGINEGANASFTSAQDLYTKLSSRTTGNVKIYAKWTPDTYKVIYHGNGGYTSSGQNIITDSFKFYDHYTIKGGDLFSNTDHTFIGWTTNSDGETDDGYNWTGWSGTWIYTNGEYGISNRQLHLYARWQDSCVYEFKNTYNNSPTTLDRLNLYKKYHRGAWNSESRRNLLNFRILDAETACGNYTPNYGTNNACLKTDQVNSETENKFTNENLSDYNDRVISSSITDQSYCLTDLELNKGENVGYDSNTVVKAGRMVFSIDKEDAVAKGTITKTCYIHKDVYNNYIGDITTENFIKVNDYMDKITLAEVELNQMSIKSYPISETNGDFYKVEGKVEITYKPNPIYAEKITGKQNNNCVDSTGRINDTCRLLGYGVASKFNDANLTNPSFNFSITPSLNSIFSFNTNDTCPYKVEPEIIKYTNTYKGNVDLEFRVVDTNNPFNRNTKSNWSDGMDNNKNNNKVTEYITNSDVNNSYNRTGNGSLYTNQTDGTRRIILTPDLVQRIREYNESNTYDDYTVYTEEVEGQTKTSTSFFDYIGLTKVQ